MFDRELTDVSPVTIETVCDRLLPAAGELTTGQLRARLQRLVIEADPGAAEEKRERSVAERWTYFEPTPEGTAELHAYGIPVEEAARAGRHINGLAYGLKRGGDKRSIDQLRVDVIVDLLQGKHLGCKAKGKGHRGGVHITTSLGTLAKLSEAPGEIEGFGPIAADITRQITTEQADNEWTVAVTCHHGEIIHVGTIRRRPTKTLARQVRAHYPTCYTPVVGCPPSTVI